MKNNRRPQIIEFTIDHLDPLGQGVHKEDDLVVFIPKTLPGERGRALIKKRVKGVAFAELTELCEASSLRTTPACPHFDQCGSCHYLHTSYEEELNFKRLAMEKLTKKLAFPGELTVHSAPKRFGYRERVQLHYDQARLGYHLPKSHRILEVPGCLLPEDEVQLKLKELYQNQSWKQLVSTPAGHLELRQDRHEPSVKNVKISVNRPYAEGGFTQVFGEMNQALKSRVAAIYLERAAGAKRIVDLFGGNGNLSRDLECEEKIIIDLGPKPLNLPTGVSFKNVDLFDSGAATSAVEGLRPDVLIVDPPRAGLKTLPALIKMMRPKLIIYISCHCATMVRDLESLSRELPNIYQLQSLELFDLFPSTHHFESLAVLELG